MDYETLGKEIGKMVNEKQKAYGDSFGRSAKILQEIFPMGILPEDYYNFLFVARILDKLFRIANSKDAFGEDPFMDSCGYALLAVGKYRNADNTQKAT